MITNGLIYVFTSLVLFLIGFLPTGTLPSGISDALTYFRSVAHSLDSVLPVYTALLIIFIMMIFEAAVLLFRAINWLINKIPTVG